MSKDKVSAIGLAAPTKPADSIATGLRNLADQIEAGEFDLFTTAVVVLGHTESKTDSTGTWERDYHQTFGLGPRHDAYTVRGLLATALGQFHYPD